MHPFRVHRSSARIQMKTYFSKFTNTADNPLILDEDENAKGVTFVPNPNEDSPENPVDLTTETQEGVESAIPDLKNSQVAVKDTFRAPKLVDYVEKRIGKQFVIVKQEPEFKKEENIEKDEKTDADEKTGAVAGENKQEEAAGKPEDPATAAVMKMRKNEYYYYQPPNYQLYPSRYAAQRKPLLMGFLSFFVMVVYMWTSV